MMRAAAILVAGVAAVAAADTSAPPTSRLGALRAGEQSADFAQALAPRTFEFPRDHGPHPEFRHEWWYVTGNLDAAGEERFGFELTFFRYALAPALEGRSRWRTNQIYLAHFAVTDVARGRFHFAERHARDALSLAGAQAVPFRVWLESWRIEAAPDGDTWRLRAGAGEYALALDLRAVQPPVLNGDRGLSRKSDEPGAASYYYSMPRLEVHGSLQRGGEAHAVRGLAWLDREWGSGALGRDQQGWDWFALQLDDGSALMFYALRTREGRDALSAGTWMPAGAPPQALRSEDVRLDVLQHWDSPRGGRYPARWRLRVPSLALDVEARPVLADQELATDPRYWEGAVDVRGVREGEPIGGRGYVELVGYAR
jgi:predicted secreted hydrolase